MNSRSFIESAIERIWRLGHAHANIANTSAISMTVDVPFISAVIRTRIGSDGITTNVSVITVSTRSTMPPEKPAIGVILSESMSYLSTGKWWLALFPGLALVGVVVLFDRIGSGLKALLDPSSAQL